MRGEHEQWAVKALEYLQLALTAATNAKAMRTAARIRHAISSAKGAVRAAGYRDQRVKENGGPSAYAPLPTDPRAVWTLTINDRYGNATWLLTSEAACKRGVWKYFHDRSRDPDFLEQLPDVMPDDFGEVLDLFYQHYDDADIEWELLEVTEEAK